MRLRRIPTRRSPMHGRGLFALQPIAASYRVIEYKGELTSCWMENDPSKNKAARCARSTT
ncbi:SET domain-containing protein [Paraburkholderia youngii]